MIEATECAAAIHSSWSTAFGFSGLCFAIAWMMRGHKGD